MNILLINPPRWGELLGKNPAIIEEHRGFNPPLGLLYLASAIRKFTGHIVEILDTQPLRLTYPQLEEYLRGRSFDVVGISAMTFTLIDAYRTARLAKKIMPQAKVVLGGPHTNLFPEQAVALEGVDFALIGEGEFSFLEFLKNVDDPSFYDKIPGLVYKNNEGRVVKNKFIPIDDLDAIAFPDRDLLGTKDYNSLLSRGSFSTTIVSSRGCPFQCSFCDRPLSPITSHFRFRSAGNVVDEIGHCMDELNIRDFLFYDDTFTVNRKRVFDVCEEIIKRRIDIRWDIRARVDTVDKEMLKILKEAGCLGIHYGVEAGNDNILKVIKKGFTIKKVRETFRSTKEAGIQTLAYFMIGLPSEKQKDIQDTFELARGLRPDYAHFTIFSPYPNTELYNLGLAKGIIKKDIWREFAENPKEDFKIPLWEENFTREQLYEMIVKFYKGFYLRPSYVLSRIIRSRSRSEIIKKAKAGLSVLHMRRESVDGTKKR